MSKSVEDILNQRGIPKISEVFTAMINSAKPNSEFKLIENGKFLVKNLLKDPNFVEALEKAHERGVKTKILVGPEILPYISPSEEDTLFNHLFGSYAYGGIGNLKNYFKSSSTRDNQPVTEKEAFELAKSFEKDVIGKRKYLLRTTGFIYRLLGKYETINVE